MSTNRHINKICVAAMVLLLVLTLLFMGGASRGIVSAGSAMGYEEGLFDTSSVHTIDIVMDDWDSFIETCESEEYSVCAVVIDGESCRNIGIRAKGNTSLSSVRSLGSRRYSFKLEFDHYENGKTYHGLDKLSLNNLIQDNTMMKDYLVYRMMGDFGVDAPLCSYAYITVNGEDWGLYLAVEGVEDGFLRRNYGADSGELYKPDSYSFGGGRGNGKRFNFDDFDFSDMDSRNLPQWGGMPQDGNMPQDSTDSVTGWAGTGQGMEDGMPQMPDGGAFSGMTDGAGGGFSGFGGMGSDDVKLKYIDDDPDSYSNIFDNAKTKITETDKQRLIGALKNLNEYTDLDNTVDIDEVIRYFVVHNFVCNGDSYTGAMIHNYYLYEQDGQLSMIPWDYNLAFGTFQGGDADSSINASIDSPVSGGSVDDRPMLGWIFSDESYTREYHELFSGFIDRWFSRGQLVQLIRETKALLQPFVEKDPTRFCTAEEFDTGVRTLEKFVNLRAEAVSRQLSGDTSRVDAAGLDTSDMGSMDSTMGGGKRDENGRENPADSGESANGIFPGLPGMEPGGMLPGDQMGFGMVPGNGITAALILSGISVIALFAGIVAAMKIRS